VHPETHTRQQAERFHELHQGPELLVLPNAWDVASACLFAGLNGCRAIATTSAGIAAGLGYLDGEQIPRDEMLDAVARIVAAVPVPVNADLESGYGPSAADAADTVDAAIEVGVGGINLEDGDQGAPDRLVDTQDHVAKIVAAREVAESRGVPVVLNARTDVYWRSVGEPDERLDHAIERLCAYRAAGADCLFVPGLVEPDAIGSIVRSVDGPVNVLAQPRSPSVRELKELGVARVSIGSGLMRAALSHASAAAARIFQEGSFAGLAAADELSYAQLSDLLAAAESGREETDGEAAS
jgi:2-methylisocitrate lyase-like PEP mutase family enzyme